MRHSVSIVITIFNEEEILDKRIAYLIPELRKEFQNVEIVAARQIGRETVQYVSNIYKYYVAYRLIMDKLEKKEELKRIEK